MQRHGSPHPRTPTALGPIELMAITGSGIAPRLLAAARAARREDTAPRPGLVPADRR